MGKLKLFVWEDVLRDYTSGIVVALAENEEAAFKLVKEKCSYIPEIGKPRIIEKPEAFVVWGGG